MLQRVLALGEIAHSHGLSLSSMAMRFALHTVGAYSGAYAAYPSRGGLAVLP